MKRIEQKDVMNILRDNPQRCNICNKGDLRIEDGKYIMQQVLYDGRFDIKQPDIGLFFWVVTCQDCGFSLLFQDLVGSQEQ